MHMLLVWLLALQLGIGHCRKCRNGDPIRDRGVTVEDIRTILDAHNRRRNLVAGGGVRALGGNLPKAANMKKLVWDINLALAAQAHADECLYKYFKPERNRFGCDYSQNVLKKMSSDEIFNPDWNEAIEKWFSEKRQLSSKRLNPFQYKAATDHCTQIIWANTQRIGCGYAQYTDANNMEYPEQAIYTCNYSPPGNLIGRSVSIYKEGKPCRSCTCDAEYENLCVDRTYDERGRAKLMGKARSVVCL